MALASGDKTSQTQARRLVGALPLFVVGWREVFVPLVVVLHNQHGPTLAVAGLAIAASRLGGWLHAKGSIRRPAHESAVLGGIALLLLGLAPEEGPIGLLLWFVFGVTWPILHEVLAAGSWQSWAGATVLMVAMVLAGPMALGPGTWLIAAFFLLLAWRGNLTRTAGDVVAVPAPAARSNAFRTLPFLFSFTSFLWIWLVPALLIGLGMPPQSFGVLLGISWLARWAGARAARRLPRLAAQAIVILGLPLTIAAIAAASVPWQLAAGMLVYGLLMGVIGVRPAIEHPELARLPGQAQALGEVLGPLAGVALYLAGGPTALFVGAALASIVLGIQAASKNADRSDAADAANMFDS